MNKIRVIDLLNKITNGEEVPKKIRYEEEIWKLDPLNRTYDNSKCCLFEDYIDKKYVITDVLNDEVEILEDKKIKKIDLFTLYKEDMERTEILQNNFIEINDKINEIIDKLNEGKDE